MVPVKLTELVIPLCGMACVQCEDEGVSSSQQSEPPQTVSHTGSPATDASPAAPTVFRIPPLALSGVALFLFGVSFPVVGAPALFGWMLALPVALAYWILRVRTVVTPEHFVSRRAFGSTTTPWTSVTGLLFPRFGWGRATLADGSTVRLPAVTVDSLPRLSRASGGAVPDPSAESTDTESEHGTTPTETTPVETGTAENEQN